MQRPGQVAVATSGPSQRAKPAGGARGARLATITKLKWTVRGHLFPTTRSTMWSRPMGALASALRDRWGRGNPAGRLRGSRNRLSEAVICALLRDFSMHGEKAIAKVRRTQPAAYLKILALLVPREHKVEHRNLLKELTDEELEAMIEHLKASIEA